MKKKTIAAVAGLIIGTSAICPALLSGNAASLSTADNTETAVVSQTSSISSTEMDTDASTTPAFSYANVADVAENVMPCIVAITSKSVQEVRDFFYRGYTYESESAGSGIIVGTNDTELLICTNNHVVEDATELTVSFVNDESITAHLKGTDSANDLAVVAVNLEDIPEETKSVIKTAKIGDSDSMRVGEQVVAIGNALGYGQSVTTGIISAQHRSIKVRDESSSYSRSSEESTTTYDDLIQTDAAINFGNSGGALLNMNGELIGINSAKASSNGVEGMGYAIPITKAMPILQELMTKTTRVKLDSEQAGYIGITGQDVSADATRLYGIPEGIYITSVSGDGPGAQCGLAEGDILTGFDGETITGMQDLQSILLYYSAGEEVDLTVYEKTDSGYETVTKTVTLGDRSTLQ